MKKLGVVLPTYNRCKYAKEGVDILLPQLLRNRGEVCLLITDNASPDETEQQLKPYAEKYPELITYVKQKENIGPHANFYYGIKHIDSEYVYLLGDDDLVSPNFVQIILHLLEYNPKVGMIHFNYLEGQSDLKRIKVHKTSVTDYSLCKHYQDGKLFVEDVLISPSFMSSDVFRKECMLKGLETNYHEDCYGYDWLVCLYTGVVDKPCIYYEMPLVVQRWGSWYPESALNTILGQQRVFDYLSDYFPNISSKWKERTSNNGIETIRVVLTITKNKRLYKSYYGELKNCLINPLHRFCLFVATYTPPFISVPVLTTLKAYYRIKTLFNPRII